jgi:hypothetical protein
VLAQGQVAAGTRPAVEGKVEGFADDATVLSHADRDALLAIKEILLSFARISGLKANFDKCILVPLGFDNLDLPEFFAESGFTVSNYAKILGCDVYNTQKNFKHNFNAVISQLIKVKNFWTRFNLSLPGRIAVAKTLMLSKISYLGCIMDPDPEQLNQMEQIVYLFIKGKLNVASSRITAPCELGGLGMIDIREHVTALKICWLKRSVNNDDLWAIALKNDGQTELDIFPVPDRQHRINRLPILGSILTASVQFQRCVSHK